MTSVPFPEPVADEEDTQPYAYQPPVPPLDLLTVDVPRAWNPVLRRFEPVSIVLPPPSRESLREARERADAALGDPRGRIVCLDLFTTDTETL